ncbi:hypothetical protein ACRAWF_39690 [Streptomyces sp. L7]
MSYGRTAEAAAAGGYAVPGERLGLHQRSARRGPRDRGPDAHRGPPVPDPGLCARPRIRDGGRPGGPALAAQQQQVPFRPNRLLDYASPALSLLCVSSLILAGLLYLAASSQGVRRHLDQQGGRADRRDRRHLSARGRPGPGRGRPE